MPKDGSVDGSSAGLSVESSSGLAIAVVPLPDPQSATALAGRDGVILRKLESLTGASITLRGLDLVLQGRESQLERLQTLVRALEPLWARGESVSLVDLNAAHGAVSTGRHEELRTLASIELGTTMAGRPLRPRTFRQRGFIEAMQRHDLTLAIGPAGTGKTFLATLLAVRQLQERRVERLLLTRPAVEAGERLGFLPGDLQQKVDPYLRPLYDALHLLLGKERCTALMEKGVIEVAPLAYMRGRTLQDAFVILDEAQNTTPAQMRMALTRIGENARMVVTGDITQIDLPPGQPSGLVEAAEVLEGVEGVAICRFGVADVVRHPLVQRLVQAYERRDQRRQGHRGREVNGPA